MKSRILTLIHQHKEVEVVVVPQHVSPRVHIHPHQMGAWESLPDQDVMLQFVEIDTRSSIGITHKAQDAPPGDSTIGIVRVPEFGLRFVFRQAGANGNGWGGLGVRGGRAHHEEP